MSVLVAAGQHGPGDSSKLISDCNHDFVARCTLAELVYPLPEACSVVLYAQQHRSSTVDRHAPEIDVAALVDAEQPFRKD